MKIKPSTFTPMLVLASTAFILPAAAVATLPYNNGDFILGFRTTGPSNSDGLTSPAGTDFEINLGNATTFIGATAGTVVPSVNINADLVAIFGPNWYSRADLFWSISGVVQPTVSGIASNTLFATRVEDTLGIQSTPWARLSTFASGAPANKMVSLAGASFGYAAGTSATLNQLESSTSGGGLIQNTGGPQSYASFQPGGANTTGATAFGVFAGGIEGGPGAALDMYELNPGSGTGTFLGAFQINNSGAVSFDAGTVAPEPSSLAIVGAGAGLLGILRRRRATRP